MKCKKHGEIENRTLLISIPVQPIITRKNGEDIKAEPYDKGAFFCLECLMEFLTKKIGTLKE